MGQPIDISTIEDIVRRASRRLRWQAALEGGTTWLIATAAFALVAVFLVRAELVAPGLGLALLCASPLLSIGGAAAAALRTESDERVARRVDRASGLSDRLSTALAFQRLLAQGKLASDEDPDADPEVTRELMKAAIADGIAAAPRARLEEATPYHRPRDLRPALGFVLVSALAAGLAIPSSQRTPQLYAALPDHGAPGAEIVLRGADLLVGAKRAPGAAPTDLPQNASVFLGAGTGARPVVIRRWAQDELAVVIPAEAPLGETELTAYLGKRAIGPVRFVVVDAKDSRFHKEDAVAIEEQELEYLKTLLADIRLTAKQEQAQALEDYVAKVEKLLEQAERGELTKEQLLNEMEKAKSELDKGAEPSEDELAKELQKTGEELAKDPLTKELGKALQQNDLEKAKQEMEKLADKLEKKELSEKEQQKLAEKLQKASEQFEKRQEEKQKQAQQQKQDLEEQVRRLQKEKQEAKNDQDREDAERRLQKKKDELEKLERQQEERDQSAQREAVKRLHKDMDKAAEQLQKRDRDQQDQQQQASRNLKDAARETGRVQEEQRKQTAQKKVASQMEDLKEAMRRAKQKGNKGPQSPFGKNQKQSDFAQRARGQQGNRTAWKPGQGQKGQGQGQGKGKGQGQGQPGGQGQDPGGSTWGEGHDDNLTGDATEKGGHTKDEDLQGVQGKGPSRRQTILAAAQKGFATAKYQEVYADYKRIVEEVMRSEKVPSSYKYYVKRYFNQIRPKN